MVRRIAREVGHAVCGRPNRVRSCPLGVMKLNEPAFVCSGSVSMRYALHTKVRHKVHYDMFYDEFCYYLNYEFKLTVIFLL